MALAPKNGGGRSQEELSVEETMNLIEEAETRGIFSKPLKDVVLVIGNTGAGKSAITQFLVNPESLEVYDAGDRVLIRDQQQRISEGSTIISKTLFPEAVIDRVTQTVYYDLPGFSDTRNAATEIANAWFMRKIADCSQRVKLLFIVNYSSLRSGETKFDLKKFMEQAVKYIRNPEKFQPAMGLVASKYEFEEEPERIIGGIAKYLEYAKKDFKEILVNEPVLSQRASQIIDALLTKDDHGAYCRISYFKQPKVVGPLVNSTETMSQRPNIMNLIIHNLKYVTKSDSDFGISVSADAINISKDIAQFCNSRITESLCTFCSALDKDFLSQIHRQSFEELGTLFEQFCIFQNFVQHVASSSTTREKMLQALTQLQASSSFDGLAGVIEEIKRQMEYLDFFEKITDRNFPGSVANWLLPLQETSRGIQSALLELSVSLNDYMETQTALYCSSIIASLQDEILTSSDKPTLLEYLASCSKRTGEYVQNLRQAKTFNEFIASVRSFLKEYGQAVAGDVEKTFFTLTHDIPLEDNLSKIPTPFKRLAWIRPFEDVATTCSKFQTKLQMDLDREEQKSNLDALNQEMTNLEQNFQEKLRTEQERRDQAEREARENEKELRTRIEHQEDTFKQVMEEREKRLRDQAEQSERLQELQRERTEEILEEQERQRERQEKEINDLKTKVDDLSKRPVPTPSLCPIQ